MVKMVFKNRAFFKKTFSNLRNEKYFKSFHRSVTSSKKSQGIQMNNNKKIFKHMLDRYKMSYVYVTYRIICNLNFLFSTDKIY